MSSFIIPFLTCAFCILIGAFFERRLHVCAKPVRDLSAVDEFKESHYVEVRMNGFPVYRMTLRDAEIRAFDVGEVTYPDLTIINLP